jgi:CubicO group peptidase (beta-lactamase class C family)
VSKSWGDFVEERIMEPLEMNHSAASFVRLKIPYYCSSRTHKRKTLKVINATKTNFFDAAAGIYSV